MFFCYNQLTTKVNSFTSYCSLPLTQCDVIKPHMHSFAEGACAQHAKVNHIKSLYGFLVVPRESRYVMVSPTTILRRELGKR